MQAIFVFTGYTVKIHMQSGLISSRPHTTDFPPNGGLVREIPADAVITVQVMKQNKVRPENKYGTPGPSHGGLVVGCIVVWEEEFMSSI